MAYAQPAAPAQPQQLPMLASPSQVTHDVTIVTTKKVCRARAMGVPPEEFGIERGARDIKTCNYCFHEVVTKSEAQLIAEGFDEQQIKSISDYTGRTEVETLARDTVQEHFNTVGGPANPAARLVKITEHYVRLDYEGNGLPCLYQIITGGDQGVILKKNGKDCITQFDAIPFAAATPVPVTHRFFGRSVADLVMDIQRIKTALMRGMLDNLYLHNNPRVEVAETMAGPNTLDDLLVSRPGGVVRTKQPGGLNWQEVPDITGSIYPALEYLDTTREMRTGVTRQSQGVDANALQNQSATAVAQAFSMSQAKMKLIARILAEGVRDIFSLLHATIQKHGQQSQVVRLRNQWVNVDPREWKTREDMTINVGLGTGGKGERVAHLMALANFQKELLLGGKTNLVDDAKLYNTFKQLSRLMDYKNADQFINDPMAKDPKTGQLLHPPPPPQPDPKLQQIQLQAQLQEKADQNKAQIEQVQAQADIATQNQKTQAEMIQNERDFQLKKELALLDFELQSRLAEAEEARKQREHEQKMQHAAQLHDHALQQAQLGIVQGAQAHAQKMEQNEQRSKAQD
jgi:hypothetical protein